MNEDVKDQFEMTIEAINEDYNPNDDRWIKQINQLYLDLQSEVGNVRKEVIPQEGRKGGLESIILALGSAGVITAAVDIFRAWLGRDRSRQLKLTTRVGNEVKEIVVSGTGISSASLEKFLGVAWDRTEGRK
ncbi:MAG: hypothetical protein ACFFCW_31675 [Candidatus Hodarchaeota archaeon]